VWFATPARTTQSSNYGYNVLIMQKLTSTCFKKLDYSNSHGFFSTLTASSVLLSKSDPQSLQSRTLSP